MKLKFALAGLAALAGAALGSGSASAAMPNGLSNLGTPANVEQVRLVCDAFGRCFRRPNFIGPRFYGGGGYYGRPRFYRGGPRFYGPRYGRGYRRF